MPVPYLLTALLFFPAIGALITYVAGRNPRTAKIVGTGMSLVPLALSTYLVYAFLFSRGDLAAFVSPGGRAYYGWEQYSWIPQVGVQFILGVDELSIFLVFLTTLLTPLALLFSWDEHHRIREFYAMFLFMETTILGVFLSLDFFLFFIFWEAGLVPMYFIIAVWGGPRKRYAAIKFFLYTQAASLLVLLAIFAFYANTPAPGTFDMTYMIDANPLAGLAPLVQGIVFVGLLIGFGTKLPTWPLHTWLPDAHVEAPTGGSVLLAGILLKLGGYGLVRVNVQMMEEAAMEWWWLLALLGIISIVYGALVCLAQDDLKRLVAYSSVSHMGFVTLGLAAGIYAVGAGQVSGGQLGFAGAVFQMFAHGLVAPALFMVAGAIGHKLGTRNISELGGLAKRMPTMTWFAVIAFLASLGLPGLVGFVAEFTVFLGVYAAWGLGIAIPILTVVLTAAYYIFAAQRAFFGPLNPMWEDAEDAHGYESVPLAILTVLFVVFGVLPLLFLQSIYDWSGGVLAGVP